MKRISRKNDKQWQDPGPWPMPRTLMRMLLLSLLFLANQAMAGLTYRMVGGECTDSNRPEVFFPDAGAGGAFGPGPKLCANQIFAQITLHDGYVPGTLFQDFDQPGAKLTVESFSFTDSARPVATTFPPAGRGGIVKGVLPASLEATELDVSWFEGWFFRTKSDGTWMFGEEFGARDARCGIGSIEGPNLTGDACKETIHYTAVGTYDGWIRVPEPPAIAVLALALAVMGSLRYLRR